MADGAITRQPELDVGWIVAICEVGRVAGVTLRRRSFEYVIGVACDAGECGVRAGERISGVLQVVKLGIEPAVHGVAALAGIGQTKSDVIENGGKEVFLVAGIAGGGQADELSDGGLLVALFALHQRVRSYQRKAVLVV